MKKIQKNVALLPVSAASDAGTANESLNVGALWGMMQRLDLTGSLPAWSLTPEHEASLLELGINRGDALAAGIFSVTAEQAKELIGYEYSGIAFIYFNESGSSIETFEDGRPYIRLKTDHGDPKYLGRKGERIRAYFPRVPLKRRPKKNRLLFTEGEKKALASTLNGFYTIGISGVNCFSNEENDLLPELQLAWASFQEIVIMFDSDACHKLPVARAVVSLGRAIVSHAVATQGDDAIFTLSDRLRYSLLPTPLGGGKWGVDDFLVEYGKEGLQELLDAALPLFRLKVKESGVDLVSCFYSEPCGDSKQSPRIDQRHLRSLLGYYSVGKSLLNAVGLSYYRVNPETLIWEPLAEKEQWSIGVPQEVADANHWRNRANSLQREMMDMITARCSQGQHFFDPPHLIAFQNGVLNRRTGEFRPIKRSDLLTRRMGFDYDPKAVCPNWIKILAYWFEGDTDTVALIRALFRWSLEPKADEKYPIEVWPVITGRPGRGKGTFLDVLIALASSSSTYDFSSVGCDVDRFKMLNALISIDTDIKGRLDSRGISALIKIISNEPVAVKKLYKNGVTKRINTVPWGASNNDVLASTENREKEGLERRLIKISFDKRPQKKDPFLSHRLHSELAGIYNWVFSLGLNEAIEHIAEYLKSSRNIEVQIDQLIDSNNVFAWLTEANFPEKIESQSSPLYDAYVQWCEGDKTKPMGKRNFSANLLKFGATKKKLHGRVVYTIPAYDDMDIPAALGLF